MTSDTEEELGRFVKNSVKFHALGKSHILNCASEYVDSLSLIMNQNPIGYNVNKKIYSAIFANLVVDMFPVFNDDDTFDISAVAIEKPNGDGGG